MPSHYVDVDNLVSQYEYSEESPEEFDDNFFTTLVGDDNETN